MLTSAVVIRWSPRYPVRVVVYAYVEPGDWSLREQRKSNGNELIINDR